MRGMNKKYSHDNEFHINHNNNNNNMATTETISVFSGNLFIGLCLSVLATLMNSTGMNLQRYSKTKDKPCLNVIGIILSTACGLVDMCSFHCTTIITSTCWCITLVQLIISTNITFEKILLLDLLSTLLVFVGTITCLYYGSRHKQTYELDGVS